MPIGRNNLIALDIKIDNMTLPAFIDTGASCAFIDRAAYANLCKASKLIDQQGLRRAKIASVQCSNGNIQHVSGEFTTTMKAGPIEMKGDIIVVEKQPIPLLIGGDVLIDNNISIDYLRRLFFGTPSKQTARNTSISNATMTTNRRKTFAERKQVRFSENITMTTLPTALPQEVDEIQSELPRLVTTGQTLMAPSDYTVTAESQHILWCEIPNLNQFASFDQFLIEPDKTALHELGLLSTEVVATINSGRVPLTLLNLSAKPIAINKGRRLARAIPVEDATSYAMQANGDVQPAERRLSRAEKLTKILSELKYENALNQNVTEKQQLHQLIDKHLDVFAESDEDIGQVQLIEHQIDTGDAAPIRARARFYSPTQRIAIKAEIDKYKAAGIVRPSSSPWAAPVLIVKKKDGSNRMCVDYRQLNMVTVPDSFPLPHMRTLFDKLCGAKWFSAFDVLWGYHNIPVATDSISKTAFIANDEFLEFTRMPFGLSNAPATFQRMIMTALIGLGNISAAYLDDVLVYGNDLKQLLMRMDLVLERIKEAGLKLKPRKCVLPVQEIVYLGYQVSDKGVSPIQAKLNVIRDWPTPQTIKELRGFLGFVNRYFSFYPALACVTAPLARTTGKRTLVWTATLQTAFEKTKEAFATINTLSLPNPDGKYVLETDASQNGLGACLLQVDTDGQEKPIGYYSKALNSAQQNYTIHKLEFFALYQAVKHFAVYLAFLDNFEVRVDNQALRFWRTAPIAPGDVRIKWKAFLDPFRFDIVHQAGSDNTIADAISRAPHTVSSTPNRPSHVNSSMQPALAAATVARVEAEQQSTATLNIKASYNKDHAVIIAVLKGSNVVRDETVRAGSIELKELYGRKHELVIQDGLIMHRNGEKLRLYVPKKKRTELLEATHAIAHQSAIKMFAALHERYWWPSIRRDIVRHVAVCEDCLRTKTIVKKPHVAMQLFPAAARFELVHIDILGGRSSLPTTETGKKYILNIIDHFTRYCVAIPLADQKAETVADAFVKHWVWRFGAPMRLHSDQGTNFESTLFAEMCQRLHIAKSRTLAYNPQSNGSVERVNRTILALLRALVSDIPNKWDEVLPQALFAYNATPHRSTGVSPFMLVHGDEARLPVELIFGSPPEAVAVNEFTQQLVENMANTSELARIVANRGQRLAKDYYDANVHIRLYKTGDIVYVQEGQLKPNASHKLAARWFGPCIVQTVRNVQVEVLDPKGKRRRIHHNRLSAPVPALRPKPASLQRGREDRKRQALEVDSSSEEESNEDEITDSADRTTVNKIRREAIGLEPPEELPDSDDEYEDAALDQTTEDEANNEEMNEKDKELDETEENRITFPTVQPEHESEQPSGSDTVVQRHSPTVLPNPALRRSQRSTKGRPAPRFAYQMRNTFFCCRMERNEINQQQMEEERAMAVAADSVEVVEITSDSEPSTRVKTPPKAMEVHGASQAKPMSKRQQKKQRCQESKQAGFKYHVHIPLVDVYRQGGAEATGKWLMEQLPVNLRQNAGDLRTNKEGSINIWFKTVQAAQDAMTILGQIDDPADKPMLPQWGCGMTDERWQEICDACGIPRTQPKPKATRTVTLEIREEQVRQEKAAILARRNPWPTAPSSANSAANQIISELDISTMEEAPVEEEFTEPSPPDAVTAELERLSRTSEAGTTLPSLPSTSNSQLSPYWLNQAVQAVTGGQVGVVLMPPPVLRPIMQRVAKWDCGPVTKTHTTEAHQQMQAWFMRENTQLHEICKKLTQTQPNTEALRLIWWAWQSRLVTAAEWDLPHPSLHVHRVRGLIALTRTVVMTARTNNWEQMYWFERAECQVAPYHAPEPWPQHDWPVRMARRPMGTSTCIRIGHLARAEYNLQDREKHKTQKTPWQNWAVTKRTQSLAQKEQNEFLNLVVGNDVHARVNRTRPFLRYWSYLMENMVDLLPTVMTMHQAPAIDILHALELRTADMRDRLYDATVEPRLPFVPPLPFKTAKPSNKLKWDMCGLENIQYQPMDAARTAEVTAQPQPNSITLDEALAQAHPALLLPEMRTAVERLDPTPFKSTSSSRSLLDRETEESRSSTVSTANTAASSSRSLLARNNGSSSRRSLTVENSPNVPTDGNRKPPAIKKPRRD